MPRTKTVTAPPKAAKHDSRICFGISYFTSEADAKKYHDYVRSKGFTYNGGWFDGMACGRDKTFDHTTDGVTYYAVTD